MAEALSLGVNIIQIISTCAATIKTINDLVKQYKDAANKLESLASEADLVKATLNQLHKLLTGNSSSFAGKLHDDPELRAAIDRTLTGCWTVFLLLHKELGKLLPTTTTNVGFKQKAALLYNDEIIQGYRSQIRGHVQGLESVLVCLQAQTVSETHEILRKASETLAKIANATLNIRKQHREYFFPESVYEGYTTFDEDKGFDRELLSTPAYRAALVTARRDSLIDGNTSFAGASSQSAHTQKQPSKDFLTDQPPEERDSRLGNTELLDAEGCEDLISFGDHTGIRNGIVLESPSSPLADLEGLSWGFPSPPTIPHPPDEKVPKTIADKVDEAAQPPSKQGYVESQSPPPFVETPIGLTVQESKDILVGHKDSHESGQAGWNQVSDGKFKSYRPPNTSAIIIDDEKIPVSTENTIGDLSPLSPNTISPFSEQPLPANHRWSNPPAHIPLADDHLEQHLLSTMLHCSVSPDPGVRLDWAEDALRHCAVGAAHKKRLAEMKVDGKAPQAVFSERESVLMAKAAQVIQELRVTECGRAYFLSARYVVDPEERAHQYLLAYGKGYHRSLFYLGRMSEENDITWDAVRRYNDGSDGGDAACLYRLAQAHLNGQLGIRRTREKGVALLQKAAEAADKDCPDPLHHLANLHLEPPPSRLSRSNALVQHSPAAALSYLRKASLLGHAPSQLRLGQLHRCGYFDPKDAKKAARKPFLVGSTLSRRASSASTVSIGTQDAEIDHTLAMHYLHLAARRGLPEADYEIAHYLLWDNSELTKQQQRLAFLHATRASLGGVPLAYGLMGKVYEEGIWCKQNLKKAEEYYYEGRKEGDAWARARSDALRNQGVGLDGHQAIYMRS